MSTKARWDDSGDYNVPQQIVDETYSEPIDILAGLGSYSATTLLVEKQSAVVKAGTLLTQTGEKPVKFGPLLDLDTEVPAGILLYSYDLTDASDRCKVLLAGVVKASTLLLDGQPLTDQERTTLCQLLHARYLQPWDMLIIP